MRADLRLFRYAVAVADEAGFGRAAAKLGISQPPLSQRIGELEASLGVKLFDRGPAGTTPTAAGAAFLERARVALREADRAMELARSAARGEVGELALGVAGGAMFSILPGMLRGFRARYPEVGLSILNLSPDEQMAQLADGRIDAGFTRLAPCPPSVILELAHTEPYMVALSSSSPHGADTGSIDLADLADDMFVLFPRQGSGFHMEVLALCMAAGFSPRIAQEIAPMHAVVGLVGAGLGIAVVPDSACVLAFPGVVYRPLRGLERASKLYLASHRERRSPGCATFIRFAKEYLA